MNRRVDSSADGWRRFASADPRTSVRDHRSDHLKALAIVGVVCIHVDWPWADAFRYCVPVFVALWAFFLERGLSRQPPERRWRYVRQRFTRLFVPYAFWTLLYLSIFHAPAEWTTTPLRVIVNGWFGGYGWSGQYFFVILFQLIWLVPLLRSVVTPSAVWIVLVLGTLVNAAADSWWFEHRLVLALNDRLFVYWIPYVVLGVAFARGFPRRLPWLAPLALLLLLAVPLEMGRLVERIPRASAYLLPSATLGSGALLLALASRLPLAAAAQTTRRFSRLARLSVAVGRNSLAIFVGHVAVLAAARRFGLEPDASLPGLLGKAALTAAAIGGGLAIGAGLRRLGLGVLVGR